MIVKYSFQDYQFYHVLISAIHLHYYDGEITCSLECYLQLLWLHIEQTWHGFVPLVVYSKSCLISCSWEVLSLAMLEIKRLLASNSMQFLYIYIPVEAQTAGLLSNASNGFNRCTVIQVSYLICARTPDTGKIEEDDLSCFIYLNDPDFSWSIQRVSNEWVASKWICYGSGASVNGRPKHIHACATPSCPEVFGILPVNDHSRDGNWGCFQKTEHSVQCTSFKKDTVTLYNIICIIQ